jgi:predicted TPR repeat methyltransferase
MNDKPGLEGAYDLKTPADSLQLYAEWANTYDKKFAKEHAYIMHQHVARAYINAGGFQPVLDVGAGTGLCGQALRERGLDHIDATDISPEMLEVAKNKGIYHTLIEGDILVGLDVETGTYAGLVSSGTFTHGHVGPEALDELLRLVRSGGWIVISIHREHFTAHGFAAKFETLDTSITDLELRELPIYDASGLGTHADDTGFVALFRKA